MTYGAVLDYFIRKTGISRAELARRVGIGRSQVTELINGKTREPTLTRAKQMADALGVTLEEMLNMMFDE